MGRILTCATNGKPLSGLKVILGKEKIAQTNDDGVYIFEGVKSGSYPLQVKGGKPIKFLIVNDSGKISYSSYVSSPDDYQFSESEVKIAPNAATLNDIHPAAFKICGKIQKLQNVPVTILFKADNDVTFKAETSELGEYCLHLASGNYTVDAVSSGTPKEKLLWLVTQVFDVYLLFNAKTR